MYDSPQKDGFMFIDNKRFDDIFIEQIKLDESIEYINKQKIKNITFNTAFYTLDNIDFINCCQTIESVRIQSAYFPNINKLYELNNLKILLLQQNSSDFGEINLSLFPKLEELLIYWGNQLCNLSKCVGLKSLSIFGYKAKNADLSELSSLVNLENLRLTHGNIASLYGVNSLVNLKKLELYYIRKLIDISEVTSVANTLIELYFENCPNIESYEVLSELKKLDHLRINKCNNIPNLKFVLEMDALRKLSFTGTNVMDGNISPCDSLEFVGFDNKKHYSIKFEERNVEFCKKNNATKRVTIILEDGKSIKSFPVSD